MTKKEIDELMDKYKSEERNVLRQKDYPSTQYDDRSALTNYALVREFKPKVVVEFGARTGRCSHDMLHALLTNGKPFIFESFEIDDGLRKDAQRLIYKTFREKSITFGKNIMRSRIIPDNIEYLFVDNSHDEKTTKWLFSKLLPKCKPGAIVMIHDVPLLEDWTLASRGVFEEAKIIKEMHDNGTLPLEKLYWNYHEGGGRESTWWTYKPVV